MAALLALRACCCLSRRNITPCYVLNTSNICRNFANFTIIYGKHNKEPVYREKKLTVTTQYTCVMETTLDTVTSHNTKLEIVSNAKSLQNRQNSHISQIFNFWASVTSNGSPCATGPLSCLSVTLVHCDQTVGWIKMPLATEIGLGPCDIVSAPSRKGAQQPPPFGPRLLWPNGRPSQQLLGSCWSSHTRTPSPTRGKFITQDWTYTLCC